MLRTLKARHMFKLLALSNVHNNSLVSLMQEVHELSVVHHLWRRSADLADALQLFFQPSARARTTKYKTAQLEKKLQCICKLSGLSPKVMATCHSSNSNINQVPFQRQGAHHRGRGCHLRGGVCLRRRGEGGISCIPEGQAAAEGVH